MDRVVPSLVIPYGSHSSTSCGYCKCSSNERKNTWGMNAIRLTVSDYQYLIDRGWRRSGTYCYKPLNKVTCCPSYTIRCDALNFHMTKSHKRVLKTVNAYLTSGKLPSKYQLRTSEGIHMDNSYILPSEIPTNHNNLVLVQPDDAFCQVDCSGDKDTCNRISLDQPISEIFEPVDLKHSNCEDSTNHSVSGISGSNLPEKAHPNKAHNLRWAAKQEQLHLKSIKERRPLKDILQEYNVRRQNRLQKNRPKCLEDFFFSEPARGQGKHFLEVRLIRSSPVSPEFEATKDQAHNVYQRYQTMIHNDDLSDCDLTQFMEFLVKSPLIQDCEYVNENSMAPAFGSYHQHYWLDGVKLIAVGVIDLLPRCLSSVYLFYDPDYAFLNLGTYSALREIAFVRQLARSYGPDSPIPISAYKNFNSYYMGYFIRSCPKMAYKARFGPAYLACPESYNWVPINDCLKALDRSKNLKYSRFSDPNASDPYAIPSDLSTASLFARIRCQLKYGNDLNNSTTSPRVMTLDHLQSFLPPRTLVMFRDWACLLGTRVLSDHFRIVFDIT